MRVTACPRVIEVAMDSGSVDHVMHPDELPEDIVFEPNTTGRHFKGAGASGSHITNFGSARTRFKDDQTGRVAECKWSLADVARPLHSALKNHWHHRASQAGHSVLRRQVRRRAGRNCGPCLQIWHKA